MLSSSEMLARITEDTEALRREAGASLTLEQEARREGSSGQFGAVDAFVTPGNPAASGGDSFGGAGPTLAIQASPQPVPAEERAVVAVPATHAVGAGASDGTRTEYALIPHPGRR